MRVACSVVVGTDSVCLTWRELLLCCTELNARLKETRSYSSVVTLLRYIYSRYGSADLVAYILNFCRSSLAFAVWVTYSAWSRVMLSVSTKLLLKWAGIIRLRWRAPFTQADDVGVYFNSVRSCNYKDKCLYIPYNVWTCCLMTHVRYLASYTLEQPGQMKDEPSRLLAGKLTEYCIVFNPILQPTFPLYLSVSFFCPALVFVLVLSLFGY